MVSSGEAMVRVMSERARPSVLVPASMPIRRRAVGSAATKSSISVVVETFGSDLGGVAVGGGIVPEMISASIGAGTEVPDAGEGGVRLFHVTPEEPLPEGEYAVRWDGEYWDFGVD